jgi:hypothetical protein
VDKITYVFDIDGTICHTLGSEYESSVPYPERIDRVNTLYQEGHTVLFLTARGMGRSNNDQIAAYKEMYAFTEGQLSKWGVKHHGLFMGKPAADIYVDDKAIGDRNFFKD